jgi:TP901 family phage tail tape measure protein
LNEDLKILIEAGINEGLSVRQINKDLKKLATHPSIQKLKLGIMIDKSLMAEVIKLIAELKKANAGILGQGNAQAVAQGKTNNNTAAIKAQTVATQQATAAAKNWRIEQQKTYSSGKKIVAMGNTVDNSKHIETTSAKGKVNTVDVSNELKDIKQIEKANAQLIVQQKQQLALENQITDAKRRASISAKGLMLNPTADKASVQKIINELNQITTTTPKATARIKELQFQLRELSVSASAAAIKSNSMIGAFQNALVKFPIWMAASTAFFGVIRGIRSALENIIAIDTQMVTLARVSNGDISREKILKDSNEMAQRLGKTIREVNDGIIEFAKQGFRGEGLLSMTEASTLFSNISDLNVDEASSGLTAIMKGFNILPENIMGAVDSINEVDNNFSVTSANIVKSIQKSVGAAQAFGVSLEELIGYTTAIGQVTRESGNIIGNSLKTIFTRITTMKDSTEAIQAVGVNTHEMVNGIKTIRPVAGIIDDLSVKWKDLSAAQQQETAVKVAGVFQLSRFLTLMQQQGEAVKATATALDAEGSAARENAEYLKSLQARIEMLKNAWINFSLAMGDAFLTSTFISIVSSLTGIAKSAGFLVDKLGLLPVLFSVIIMSMTLFSAKFRTAMIGIVSMTNSSNLAMRRLGASTYLLGKQMGLSAAAARVLRVAIQSLVSSTIVGVAFIALGVIIEKALGSYTKWNEARKEQIAQDNASIASMNEHGDKVKNLTRNYLELSQQEKLTAEQSKKLLEIKTELSTLMPSFISGIDSEGNAHFQSAEYIQLEIDRLKALKKQKDDDLVANFGKTSKSTIGDIFDNKTTMSDKQSEIDHPSTRNIQDWFDKDFKRKAMNSIANTGFENDGLYIKLKEDLQSYNDTVLTSKGLLESVTKADQASIKAKIDAGIELVKNASSTEEATLRYSELKNNILDVTSEIATMRKVVGAAGNVFSTQELQTFTPVQVDSLKKVSTQLAAGDLDWGKHTLALTKAGLSYDRVTELQHSFVASQQATIASLEDGSEAVDVIAEDTTDYVGQLKSLNQVISDVKSGQVLSADAVFDLIKLYPELAAGVEETVGGYKLEAGALEALRQIKLKKVISDVESENKSTLATIKATEKRIKASQIELKAIQALADAKNGGKKQTFTGMSELFPSNDKPFSMNGTNKNNLPILWDEASQKSLDNIIDNGSELKKSINADAAAVDAGKKEIEANLAEIEWLKKTASDPNFGVNKEKQSKDKEKDFIDETQARINAINKESVAISELNKLTEDRAKELESEEEYSKAIAKTNSLIASQKEEVSLLKTANSQLQIERDNLQKGSKNKMSSWLDSKGEQSKSFIGLYNRSSPDTQQVLKDQFDKWKLLSGAITENEATLSSLNKTLPETAKYLDDLNLKNTQFYLDKQGKALDEIEYNIQVAEKTQAIYSEGTAKYNEQQLIQNDILQDKVKFLQGEVNWAEKRLVQGNLTIDQILLLNEYLKTNKLALLDAQKAAQSLADTMANDTIESYKKMLEQQRDLELDGLDRIKDAEDERHDKVMDHYDEEMDKFEKQINAQLKSMDRLNESDDHTREMQKLADERSKVQNKYNTLLKDNSFEGKSKRADLQKQLNDIDEQIADKQRDRGRETTKQGLDDLLTDRKDYIDQQKDLEDDAYNATKKKLDSEKRLREDHWKSILEDDAKFLKLKQDLMSGDAIQVDSTLSKIRGEYDTFFTYLTSQSEILGKMFASLNSNFKIDYDKLNNFPSSDGSTGSGSNSDTSTRPDLNSNQSAAKESAWNEYLNNKQKAEVLAAEIKKGLSTTVAAKKREEIAKLKIINDGYRTKFNFPDKSYNELKDQKPFSAKSGGITPSWGKDGKFLLAHEKELVLNKSDTSNMLKLVDVTRGIIDSIRNFNPSSILSKPTQSSSSSAGTVIENIQMTFTGNLPKDGMSFADEFVSGLNRKGIRVGR